MAGESGEREITSVSIIQDLSDTDYIIVSDGIDVKKIAKKDLIKNLGTADKITLETISGMTATTVQAGIAENHTAIINAAHEEEDARKTAIADKELKSYSLTLAVADVVANTDEYATETVDHSAYPYCVNHAMSDVTADTQAHINYSSNMAVQDRSWKTLAGVFRIYLKSMPTAAIDIQFTLQKGTVVA